MKYHEKHGHDRFLISLAIVTMVSAFLIAVPSYRLEYLLSLFPSVLP